MAQIIDQIVKISITDAVSGVTTADVNTVAIVGKASTGKSSDAGEYASAEDVGAAYGTDSELYAMAVKFFAQDSQPSTLVAIPASEFAAALEAAKTAADTFAFYHVCVATSDTLPEAGQLESWQDWLADAKKILHVQAPASEDNAKEIALMAELKAYGADRVAVYLHTEDHVSETTTVAKYKDGDTSGETTSWSNGTKTVTKVVVDENNETTTTTVTITSCEFLNVAIVALRCAADSARGTFAHRKCGSTTADTYGTSAYTKLINAGLNIYLTVAGEARLFMGTTCDSSHFIDEVAKDDWIRFNVQSKIFALLGDANDGHGVNYDDAGIASVAATVLNVLNVAQDNDHQYVMADSATVSYKDYDYLKENRTDDVKKRNLPLISGNYARMNAIHTVQQVSLQVTL